MNYPYTLIRQLYRRSLMVTISGTNEIVVKASKTLPKKEIEQFLRKKTRWIEKTLHFNASVKKPYVPKEFYAGESFLYLGKKYPLVIKQGKKTSVTIEEKQIVVCTSRRAQGQQQYIKKNLIQWYKRAAYKVLLNRVSLFEAILKVSITDLAIKTMKQTWGNCSRAGKVTFNWKLVMAPQDILDYLVVHELCHLIHHNHSPRFWKQVKALIPHYKTCQEWLKINENTLEL